ncbi:DUF6603 domain-containing protein [Streptomyces sp. NPDC007861]|uniref:DUF6603 domain-containing protein n=1 Tax=Streptomyces sp. NPDC007861 TaxID=3154893 RepID=UPI0033D37514
MKIPVVGTSIGLKNLEVGYVFGNPDETQQAKMRSLLATEAAAIELPAKMSHGGFLLASVDAGTGGVPLPILVPFAQGSQQTQQSQQSVVPAEGLPELAEAAPIEPVAGEATGAAPAAIWKEVNRSLGPVHIDRVGLGYDSGSKAALVLLDAAIGAGGIQLGTKGLGVGIPISAPDKPVFHLDGLSLEFNRPPLTIAGEFIRQHREGYSLALGGMAVIGTPALSISALGFYAQPARGGPPSLFVFGKLDLSKKSLGGPIFRLKQLAAGFGYQTQVRPPATAGEVESFPFIKIMRESSSEHPLKVLDDVLGSSGGGPWVYPASNNIWIAAGVNGTIYELVEVTAAAVGQFGYDFSIGLYGTAEATFPKESKSPWARLALDVRAEYRASKDTLEIDAAISPSSFLVSQNCKLRGSAAVRVWFGRSRHPGEFVVTVGGYHPRFSKPDHYPAAERLGFDWHISSGIYAEGGCYAALTPHAFMAGFNVHAHGDWGPFEGDVRIYADALIEWDPFYFDLSFGGSASLRLKPFPAVEVKVHGEVWGPPVGGHFVGELAGLKKSADFGSGRRDSSKALTASEFREKLLPEKPEQVIHIEPTDGLRPGDKPSDDESTVWTAGSGFRFDVGTAVPATKVTVNGTDAVWKKPKAPDEVVVPATKLFIRPMQPEPVERNGTVTNPATGYDSTLSVTVKKGGESVPVNNASHPESWTATAAAVGVPAALWGKREERQGIADSKNGMVDGYASGLQVAAPPPRHESPLPLPASVLTSKPFELKIPTEVAPAEPTFPGKPATDSRKKMSDTSTGISSESVRRSRNAIVAELTLMKIDGLSVLPNSDLTKLGAAAVDLDANPLLLT